MKVDSKKGGQEFDYKTKFGTKLFFWLVSRFGDLFLNSLLSGFERDTGVFDLFCIKPLT